MGKIRITIELDTDAVEGSWASSFARAARQLQRAVTSQRTLPAIWPQVQADDWTERPVTARRRGGGSPVTIGRFIVDRSESGWAPVAAEVPAS
jgi:hypothetical protein